MIELKGIDVIFNQNTQFSYHALKNINFKVKKGEFITIIGGNGAGKSTLMDLIAGNTNPTNGKILIDGQDVTKLSTAQKALFVARVFQDPRLGSFLDLTIEENLSIAFYRGKSRGLGRALNQSLINKYIEALTEIGIGIETKLKSKVATLSGGQRQALSLVMATLQPSKILLLDEHTAALDPKIAKAILQITANIITKHKLTTLMITHSMSQALEYGDRTIMLYHGKLIKDMRGHERTTLSPIDLLGFFDL